MPPIEPERMTWTLTTSATPEACWALFSDTDRINRVAGLEMRFVEQALQTGHVAVQGRARSLGVPLRWDEQPYEWRENERYSVRRTFHGGPASAYSVHVTLTPIDAGTRIDYEVEVTPRNTLTRALVKIDLGAVTRPALERTLRRAVAALDGTVGSFEHAPPPLSAAAERRLERALAQLPTDVAARLRTFLAEAPLAEQQEIAPLRLARRWALEPDDVLRAMLQLVPAGVLELRWKLRCPSCRVGKHSSPKLRAGPLQVHCPSCNIPYDGSLPDALIASFRPHPEVRAIDLPIRCIGSPARTPHIVAARNVEPGAEEVLEVALLPGRYRLRTLPDRGSASLQVRPDRQAIALDLDLLQHGVEPPLLRAAPGRLTLFLRNRSGDALRLLVERHDAEPDVCTVGRLLELPDALELLPPELLGEDLMVRATSGVVLAARVAQGGEDAAEALRAALMAYEPDLAITRGDVVLATFASAARAVEAAALVEGATHLGAGLAAGPLLRLEQLEQVMPVGGTVDRALAEAGDRGVLRSGRRDVEMAAMAEAIERPGVFSKPATDAVELRIEAPLRSSPPLRAAPPAPPPEVGEVVAGRFRIVGVLARGGFGAALEAVEIATERPVVVKVLHHELASDVSHLQRFYNEGRLASRVRSRHVAEVVDYGVDELGRVWMATERLIGDELAAIIRRKHRLDAWLAVHLALDVARGLADAHAVGLVHRDIKPANLFVCDNGDARPAARIIDFGIAKAEDESLLHLRRDDTLVGTPHYMAPEQARAQPLDGRADLYALGVVLYEMLSGRLPFDGKTAVELLFARLQTPPLPLRAFCGPETLPDGLETLIMRDLLAVEPANRIADAATLVRVLESIAAEMGPRQTWIGRLEQEIGPTADPDELLAAAIAAGIRGASPAHQARDRVDGPATSAPTWTGTPRTPPAQAPSRGGGLPDAEDALPTLADSAPREDEVHTRAFAGSWGRTTAGKADTEPDPSRAVTRKDEPDQVP